MTRDSSRKGEQESDNPLGQPTDYLYEYAPHLLHAIPRQPARDQLGLSAPLPFTGVDIWNAYELSWLDSARQPCVAVAEIVVDATSTSIIESKSLKLYLNSLNDTVFDSIEHVCNVITTDLTRLLGGGVSIQLHQTPDATRPMPLDGISLDQLRPGAPADEVNPDLLCLAGAHPEREENVSETFHTHLFRSLCPITGQPDWADLMVRYTGTALDPTSLLRYLNSYRRHGGYHEQCVERIFADILTRCRPTQLSVYARFLRRGGLDINPFRSNFEQPPANRRTWRQ